MKKLIGTKEFYKKVLLIAVPIMIQNGITNFVGMLDNIMVGQIGTDYMSGVAIVGQLMFVFNICIFGAISGPGIFTSQYYGKGDYEGVRYTFRTKVFVSVFITILGLLILSTLDEQLISLYLHEGSDVGNIALTMQCGKEYLWIMLIGLIPFVVSQIYSSTLRECGETIVPMMSGIVAVLTNLVLNYILIFGNFGAPELKANGAAIATVLSRFIECGVVVIWTHKNKQKNQFIIGAYKSLHVPKKVLKPIFIKGTPLMLNEMFWSMGMTVIVQCYAFRGLATIAALNITTTITNVFNIVFIALGSSISIIVGQLLGANKKEEAKEADTQLIAFTVGSCFLIGTIMILFAGVFPSIYNTEAVVKEMAEKFIIVSACCMPLQAFAHASYFTLRSGGKTVITFLFDSVFVWVIVIPLAYFLSHYTSLGTVMVYFIVQFTEIIKCIIGFFMIKSGVWIVNIVDEK